MSLLRFRPVGATGPEIVLPRVLQEERQAMNILVIQNCPVTPIGVVGETLVARGAQLTTLFPHQGDRVPVTTHGYDGLVILGGPQHAGDDATWPAFAGMLPLIRQFHDEGRPVLGICLGAQLISRAFGGTVWPFGGLEIGYLPVGITAEGLDDPLLAGLAPEQRIMQLHEDSFDLPVGAVRLMVNDTCANQAMRLGVTTYGFQFHLEVTAQDAVNFPRDCWGSLVRHYGDRAEDEAARVTREVAGHFEEGAAFCRQVTGRWADLVAARRGWSEDLRLTA
jgi:GMP synthase-like glutamine amidotransferase